MIRQALHTDWTAISRLLDQLDYPGAAHFLEARLAQLLNDPAELLLVWEAPPAPATQSTSGLTTQSTSALTTQPISALTTQSTSGLTPTPILGFLSLHFIPQIALEGDFARISYFSIDQTARGEGIGRQLEEYAATIARERGCELIEVHCHTRRTRAHAFYYRQGYKESPKYLIKRLK
jgi:ribosomal protein S18 acetylase RimI-like enzyme